MFRLFHRLDKGNFVHRFQVQFNPVHLRSRTIFLSASGPHGGLAAGQQRRLTPGSAVLCGAAAPSADRCRRLSMRHLDPRSRVGRPGQAAHPAGCHARLSYSFLVAAVYLMFEPDYCSSHSCSLHGWMDSIH